VHYTIKNFFFELLSLVLQSDYMNWGDYRYRELSLTSYMQVLCDINNKYINYNLYDFNFISTDDID
jgi:hypothetical protein